MKDVRDGQYYVLRFNFDRYIIIFSGNSWNNVLSSHVRRLHLFLWMVSLFRALSSLAAFECLCYGHLWSFFWHYTLLLHPKVFVLKRYTYSYYFTNTYYYMIFHLNFIQQHKRWSSAKNCCSASLVPIVLIRRRGSVLGSKTWYVNNHNGL